MADELVGNVDVFEIKHFNIYAKTKLDAKGVLLEHLSEEDKLLSLVSYGRVYVAKVEKFVRRNYPTKKD